MIVDTSHITTLTLPEIFTKVVKGLAAQGWKQALGPNPHDPSSTQCLYRAGNLRCAVGQLIPDEWFVEADNATGLSSLLTGSEPLTKLLGVPVRRRDAGGFIEEVDLTSEAGELLREVQRLHDNADSEDEMRERFSALAEERGFPWPDGVAR